MRISGFHFLLLTTATLAGVSLTATANAQEVVDGTRETVAGDGSGTRPATWTVGDDLILGNGSATETVVEVIDGGRVEGINTDVGLNSDAAVVVSGSGSSWSSTNDMNIARGDGTIGQLTVANGGTVSSSMATVGQGLGSNGSVFLTGTGSTWSVDQDLVVGGDGDGSLRVENGAEAHVGAVLLSAEERSRSSITLSGARSSLTSRGRVVVSGAGSNALTVEDGAQLISGGGQITGSEGNAAIVTIRGENSAWSSQSGAITVGDVSDGQLNILDGGRVEAAAGFIGRNGKSIGRVILEGPGSSLSYRSNLQIGYIGEGSLEMAEGADLATGGPVFLGGTEEGLGTIELHGAQTRWTANGTIAVGQRGEGRILAASGAQLSTSDIVLGAETRGQGVIEIQGDGTRLDVDGDIVVGGNGDGALAVAFGARMTGRSLVAGAEQNGGAEIIVYDGHLALEDRLQIGGDGTAIMGVMENGSVSAGGGIAVGSESRLIVGGPFGRDPFAPGALMSPTLSIAAGGELIFNHSDTDYLLETDLSGDGKLTVSAGATTLKSSTVFSGAVSIEEGASLTAESAVLAGNISNNGRLVFDDTRDGAYLSQLSGTGSLFKRGQGHLTLRDLSEFQGDLTVDEGHLTVNSLFGGATRVTGTGTLSGTGTFNRLSVESGGTFAPGNSIGTTRVSGDLSFGAGATYEVEVNAGGEADLTIVNHSTRVDETAGVLVLAENRTDSGLTYSPETTYTILRSEDGLTGEFGSVTENFAFLTAELSYDPTSVYLTLHRDQSATAESVFVSKAMTRNQKKTAAGVASLSDGALFEAVLTLPDGEAEAAFNALSGEAHASVQGQLHQDANLSQDAVSRRIRTAFAGVDTEGQSAFNGQVTQTLSPSWQVWGEVYGSWSERDGDGNAAGYSRTSGGLIAGTDRAITDTWRLGAFGAFGQSSFDVNSRNSSGDTTSLTAGLYSGHQFGAWRIHAGSAFAWHGIDSSRNVQFTGVNQRLSADYSAWTGQLFAETSYAFHLPQGSVAPFVGASLVTSQTDSFSETGGGAALRVASRSETTGTTTLGVRGETAPLLLGDSFLHFSGTLAWRHAYGDLTPESSMRFDGGDTFIVSGSPIDQDTALFNAAVTWSRGQALSLDLAYTGEIGASAQDHSARAGLLLQF